MATSAFIGKGAKVYYGDVATATNFTAVNYVKTIGAVSEDSPQLEVTDLQSTAEEYINQLATTAETQMVCNADFADATQTFVRADQQAGNKRYWKIEWYKLGVLVKTATFLATVKSYSYPSTQNKAVVDFQFSLQRSGSPTYS